MAAARPCSGCAEGAVGRGDVRFDTSANCQHFKPGQVMSYSGNAVTKASCQLTQTLPRSNSIPQDADGASFGTSLETKMTSDK